MKKLVKLFALVCLLVAVCCTVAGCDGGGKIHAPFKDSDCKGEDLDSVVSQLRDAGFTNIETAPEDTAVSFNANQVISVKIGSNAAYNTANAWKPDVKIIVKYYQFTGEPEPQPEPFTVTMGIEATGEDGKPVFIVTTNLPDGAKLTLTLDDGNYYTGQQTVKVSGGKAESEPFTDDGRALAGHCTLTAVMEPGEQSASVKKVVGDAGELLAGEFVEVSSETGGSYIFAERAYDSPYASEDDIPPEPLSLSDACLAIEASLASGFGDNYTLTQDGYTVTATVWGDGIAMSATLATLGDADSLESWDGLVDSTVTAADRLQSLLTSSGHGDKAFIMQVANDLNEAHDTVLLSVSLGTVLYDYVNGIDLVG